MFTIATVKALQIYGIAIGVSMFVAVLIKLLVQVTGRLHAPVRPPENLAPPAPETAPPVPAEVVAAISAAIAIVAGPHRILHISESKRSWSQQGRDAQHSHHPRFK